MPRHYRTKRKGADERPLPPPGALAHAGASAAATRQLGDWMSSGELPAGEQLPPETALARRLGVARETLRGILRRLENEGRIIRRSERCRIVAGGQRLSSGLLRDTILVITDYPGQARLETGRITGWESCVYTGANEALLARGWPTLTLNSAALTDTCVRDLGNSPPRGVLLLRDHRDDSWHGRQKLLATCARLKIPVVAVSEGDSTFANLDTVGADHTGATYQLTRWLLEHGCRRILRIWTPTPDSGAAPAWVACRDAGFEQACAEHNILAPPALRLTPARLVTGDESSHFEAAVTLYAGALAPVLLLSPEPPDALMLISDGFVPAFTAACRRLGKVPGRDIQLVGYDDYWRETAESKREPTPPLATINKCNPEIGRAAVELLEARLNGALPSEPQHRLIAPRLITLCQPLTEA